jgi:hypothetical protein
MYLAEGEAAGEAWAPRLRSAMPIPVHTFDPLADVSTAVPAEAYSRFAGAVGLLALAAGPELPINFASPRQPKVAPDPNRKAMMIAILACTLLLGLGAVYGFLKLSEADRRFQDLTSQKQAMDEQLAQLESDGKRLQAVDDWTKREVVWLDELYDLADRFPDLDKTRVTTLTGTTIPPDKNGKQPASARMEIKLATRSPDEVAKLVTAFDRENTEKSKFYVNPTRATNGQATGANTGGFNQLFTLTTLVNHRPPEDFVRQSTATPPPPRGKKDEFKKSMLKDDWFTN